MIRGSTGAGMTVTGQGQAAPSRRMLDPTELYLVWVFLAIKAGLLAVVLLWVQLLPIDRSVLPDAQLPMFGDLPRYLRPFLTWDTNHYILLAVEGYGVNDFSNAFYPLYPLAIRYLSPLFLGNSLAAAWVISNAVSLLIPIYMYRVANLFWPAAQSRKVVLVLLAFPTAFFLSVAYAEAICLALCLAAFYYLLTKQVWTASLICFLLPLSLAQGSLFALPVLALFLQAALGPQGNWRDAISVYLSPLAATVGGIGAYLLFCYWQLGNPFAGIDAQQYSIANNSIANVLRPGLWFIRNFVLLEPALHSYTTSVIDRTLFVLALPVLIGVWRTQHRAIAVYAVVTLLVPALAGNFMSYSRHLMLVFPLSMYLGVKLKHPELLAIPMFALQVLLVVMHTSGVWVA
jgi:hypothetical protein